jgi:prepilin-type N-terminal cleavage/methylation domain-containing protein
MRGNSKAVTLIEILLVVVIVGIIAAFGIPAYNRAVERAEEKTAVDNLNIMIEALKLYKARNGNYPSTDLAQAADINNALNLNIFAGDMNYSCIGPNTNYQCSAQSVTFGWRLRFQTGGSFFVHCNPGGCPTCTAAGCP